MDTYGKLSISVHLLREALDVGVFHVNRHGSLMSQSACSEEGGALRSPDSPPNELPGYEGIARVLPVASGELRPG